MDDPALHKSPAALQVGLGWSKAKGHVPTESLALADCAEETTRLVQRAGSQFQQKRCGTRVGLSETGHHCWPSTASLPSPAVLTSSCHRNKMDRDERVRLTTMRNSPSLKSKSPRKSSFIFIPPSLLSTKVLRRQASDESDRCGYTGSRSRGPARTAAQAIGSFFIDRSSGEVRQQPGRLSSPL